MRYYDIVLGLPCSGKTTLAGVLKAGDNIDVVELDQSVNRILLHKGELAYNWFEVWDLDNFKVTEFIRDSYTGWDFVQDLTDAEEHFYNHHDVKEAFSALSSDARAIAYMVLDEASTANCFITHSPLLAAAINYKLAISCLPERINTFIATMYLSEYISRWDARQSDIKTRKVGHYLSNNELESGWYTHNDYMVHLIDWLARFSESKNPNRFDSSMPEFFYWYITLKSNQYLLDWFEKNPTESLTHEFLLYEEYYMNILTNTEGRNR